MNIKKTILSLALIFVASLNVAAQSQTEQGKDLDSLYAQNLLKTGTVAPEFSLPMPNRKIFSLADHKGKYILLDFWASWCPDCRKDIPKVKEMYEIRQEGGVRRSFFRHRPQQMEQLHSKQPDDLAARQRTEENARG